MYNSHYIPQFTLKSFGNHFDTFDLKFQKMEVGLTSKQAFLIKGLYSNELENIFNGGFEGNFSLLIKEIESIHDTVITESKSLQIHNYIIVSYLRTPFAARFFDNEEWNIVLKQAIAENYDLYDYGKENVEFKEIIEKVSFLQKSNIYLIRSNDEADTFLISDKGVSFIDEHSAIYPFSPHEAFLITDRIDVPDTIEQEEVKSINWSILNDVYEVVGMSSIEEVCRSIAESGVGKPIDKRMIRLVQIAFELSQSDPIWNEKIRENSGINKIIIPKRYIALLENDEKAIDLNQLSADKDYDSLSALIVFSRFGLISIPSSVIERHLDDIPEADFSGCLKKYRDSPSNEFEKCQSVVFLEISSEHGNKNDTDRLRRYYKDGKHVIKNLEKSRYYMMKGCRQFHEDCLTAYCGELFDDPDYNAKICKFKKQFEQSRGSAGYRVSEVYERHGDMDESLHYLKNVVHAGYAGAISKYLDYLLNHEPCDLEEIESVCKIVINRQINDIFVLAKFYSTHRDLCPGKIEWMLDELRGSDNIYADAIIKKYENII